MEAQGHEALAGIWPHGFPEMALARIHPKSPFGVGSRDRLRGLNQIARRRGFLLESLSILRVAPVNDDATKPEMTRGHTVYN